jgi:prepilin-type N-terminal cleavage/methylation domain-containing protein
VCLAKDDSNWGEMDKTRANAKRMKRSGGFSMPELMMVLVVGLIIMALGIPSFLQAYSTSQMKDAAGRVASVLKSTRFEAIRRNIPVSCLIRTLGTTPSIWTDSNGDGIEQANENQARLMGGVAFSNGGGVPNTGGLAAAVGAGALTVVSPTNLNILTFDNRGATNPAGVYVLYIQKTANPSAGYRAVIVLPSGAVQVWSAGSNGLWQQFN